MTVVYVRADNVLGVIIEQYATGARVAWYTDGILWTDFLETEEYIILNLEDLDE